MGDKPYDHTVRKRRRASGVATPPEPTCEEASRSERFELQVDPDEKLDFATFQGDYVRAQIEFADTKAAWAFAIPAGVIAYILSLDMFWSSLASAEHFWTKAIGALAAACLGTSVVAAFLVILPRLGGANEGLIYFGAVAQRSSADLYVSELAPITASTLAGACLRHNYELARVCRDKYRALRVAMWSGVLGLTFAFAFIAMLKLAALPSQTTAAAGNRVDAGKTAPSSTASSTKP